MKKIFSLLMLAVVIFCSCNKDDDDEKTSVINFNGLLSEANTEYVGTIDPNAEPYAYTESTFTDPSKFVTFNHYTTGNGSYFGGGFTYTNKTDITTAGYQNSSAITGKGQNGDTYLTCNSDETYRNAKIKFQNEVLLKGAFFTNSTYAYLSMLNGDGYGKAFTDSDWFKLTIIGKQKGKKTNSVDFYLAKDGKIINGWVWQDLTSLGYVDELNFAFESTDNDPQWGMKTPAYFCMDALTIKL